MYYHTVPFSHVPIVEINLEEDYLNKHMKRKHLQRGGRMKNVKNRDIPSTITSTDHNYARLPPLSPSNDHNYATSTTPPQGPSSFTDHNQPSNTDHNYVMPSSPQQGPSSAAGHNQPLTTDHIYVISPALQHAINNNVQDFSLQPNHHEQYHILTFLPM